MHALPLPIRDIHVQGVAAVGREQSSSAAPHLLCRPNLHSLGKLPGNKPVPSTPAVSAISRWVSLTEPRWVSFAERHRVFSDLVCVAARVAPQAAAKWVGRQLKWLGRQEHFYILFPDELAQLVERLVEGGENDAAFDLANTVLEVRHNPSAFFPKVGAQFETCYYREFLIKAIPILAKSDESRALNLLCRLLDAALLHAFAEHRGEDLSSTWRPTIEKDPEYRDDVLNELVIAIRDLLDRALDRQSERFSELIDALRGREWPIFERLLLHICRRAGMTQGIRGILIDEAQFKQINVPREYYLLLREQYERLEGEDRSRILEWIEDGPDTHSPPEKGAEPLAPEDAERLRETWRRNGLTAIQRCLPPGWKARLDALNEMLGAKELSEIHPEVTMWTGPESPLTKEELAAKPIDDLLSYLASWKPPERPMAPDQEGLGRILSTCVADNADRFAAAAPRFATVERYVSHLFSGFAQAIINGEQFTWKPVLELCGMMLEEKAPASYRREIAWLMAQGTRHRSIPLSAQVEPLARTVLIALADDPDPSPAEEAAALRNMDAQATSMNANRAIALKALIRHTHRVWTELKPSEQSSGLESFPDIKESLERHLDHFNDPSLSVRYVFGSMFPFLMAVDSTWATAHAERIFPAASDLGHWQVAWRAYIQENRASKPVFEVLKQHYERVVESVGAMDPEDQGVEAAEVNLGVHLIGCYLGNLVEYENLLLQRFYKRASDKLRGRIAESAGRLLNSENDISKNVLKRLQAFWEARRESARDNPEAHQREMQEFTSWFVSSRFDAEWTLDQLVEAILIGGEQPGHVGIPRKLADHAEELPAKVIACLDVLVKKTEESHHIVRWRRDIRTILACVLRKKDTEEGNRAEKLVQYLGSRGFVEFRDLL